MTESANDTEECMRFSTASLSIGKNGAVDAVQDALHNGLRHLVSIQLRAFRTKNVIEMKSVDIRGVGRNARDLTVNGNL